ncbi:hypothetical protein FACS189460_0570 [Deltaproteobacteria bacterium]|nr:hypothetical protein FACS189460_0570 [Deltaproteobacteria bacterium]
MKNKLRTPAAAAYLGLQANTLEVWRCHKRGPKFYKLGRSVVYDQDDLDAYVTAHGVLTLDTAPHH